jgi:hypothetical protein
LPPESRRGVYWLAVGHGNAVCGVAEHRPPWEYGTMAFMSDAECRQEVHGQDPRCESR